MSAPTLPPLPPTHIYRSNVLPPKDLGLLYKFGTAVPRELYRPACGHTLLHDPVCMPGALWMSHDEAALVYECARVGPDGPWLDIGSCLGWSTAHIALAGRSVVGLDPAYELPRFTVHGHPDWVEQRATTALASGYLDEQVFLFGQTMEEFVQENGSDERFVGIVLDGDWQAGAIMRDAKLAYRLIDEEQDHGGMILLHDGQAREVQEAAVWLMARGMKVRVYLTPNLLICCYWGEVEPPVHEPDPFFNWAQWLMRIRFNQDLLRASGLLPARPTRTSRGPAQLPARLAPKIVSLNPTPATGIPVAQEHTHGDITAEGSSEDSGPARVQEDQAGGTQHGGAQQQVQPPAGQGAGEAGGIPHADGTGGAAAGEVG